MKMYDLRELKAYLTCSTQTWLLSVSVVSGSTKPQTDRTMSEPLPLLPDQRQWQESEMQELWKHH